MKGGKYIDKKEIIERIVECAKIYDKNLNNKNIMFIYFENQEIKYLETKFTKANFLHLTGVKLEDKRINARFFYNKCIANRIKEEEIRERKDGNTKNKLFVLRDLMCIHENARIIGNFKQNRTFLFTEKLIGNITSCLGFISKEKYYICNTSLKEDIRKITYNRRKIICIVCKKIQDLKYHEITYIDEKYRDRIFLNDEINKKLSF